MKDQYFGDSRDAFKYDFWLAVAERVGGIRGVTLVPMLTLPDGTNQGSHRAYGLVRNRAIPELLRQYARVDRSVVQLRELMHRLQWDYYPYKDTSYFSDLTRRDYFSQIPNAYLHNTCVLVDPDTGLECGRDSYMRRHGRERYLFYSEVANLVRRSEGATILVIYQHLQRNANRIAQDLERRAARLLNVSGAAQVVAVRNRDVALFVLAARGAPQLESICADYAEQVGISYTIHRNHSHCT